MSKWKNLLTIILSILLVLSLSTAVYAGTPGTAIAVIRTYDAETNIYTIIDTFNGAVDGTDTVYDLVVNEYGNAAIWLDSFLRGVTVYGISYSSTNYDADPESFNEDDEYIGGDAVIDYLNTLQEFISYDGVYMPMSTLMEDESYTGYYIMGDMQHECAIFYDWIYEIDYANDGYGNYVSPLVAMNCCELSDGDNVRLTYGLVWYIWEIFA